MRVSHRATSSDGASLLLPEKHSPVRHRALPERIGASRLKPQTAWEGSTVTKARRGSAREEACRSRPGAPTLLVFDRGAAEPTGATVDLRFADVSRVRDRKIVAHHTCYDQLGLLTQLGLM